PPLTLDQLTALRALLADRVAADPAGAWGSSLLTGDGFPVEIGVVTADDRLRYTVEPGGHRLDPARRLALAGRLVEQLGGVPADTHEALPRRYGAWVGARHGPDGDTYKLYLEAERGRLRMVACTPVTGEVERYHRIPDLYPIDLPRVLGAADLESRATELLDLLENAYGHRFPGRLPGDSVGVSYTESATGEPLSVTLFFFARVFWGSDDRIRRCLTRLAPELGWDDGRYRALTAHLAGSAGRLTRHGVLGVTVAARGRPALSIGVRP
ncbi:hypothetical protein AB0F81_47250, partial [Actinoplanes sp. NPDC024001]|uniref:hypothetical protein n=1 Tax=Actinoplanes sp. NPDC024001 TaxID=3154598 RepID=UPI0033C87499